MVRAISESVFAIGRGAAMKHSPEEVLTFLSALRYPSEKEVIELKEAKNDYSFKDIGRYVSALSNEALLRGQDEAWLVFGMTNDCVPIGTNYRRESPRKLQSLKREIAGHTNTRLTIREIFELTLGGQRVLALQIPSAAPGIPTAFDGAAWSREGESLAPLPVDKYEEIRRMRREDWTGTPIDAVSLEDLDAEAVGLAKSLFLNRHATHRDLFASMSDAELLGKANVLLDGKVTPTALILLGKPESVRLLGGATPRITWTLYSSDGSVVSYEHFNPPLLTAVDKVLGKIRNEKYRFMPNPESLFPVEVSQYDQDVIRELLHNCIAHQDYSMQGRINVEEFEDRLVFINEGSFIPGSIEKAMTPGYKPSFYRNPFLCDAMVQLDMIDTVAMGIPKIYQLQRRRYFPLPTYDLSDPNRVSVTIYGRAIDESYSRLLYALPELELDTVYLLDKVQKRQVITQDQAVFLHDRGLIEGRYPHIRIAANVATEVGGEVGYVRSKGLNDNACKSLILQMLRDTGPTSRVKIIGLLDDLLPAEMTKNQKARKVSNLLAQMKNEDGTVDVDGTGKTARWHAIDEKSAATSTA